MHVIQMLLQTGDKHFISALITYINVTYIHKEEYNTQHCVQQIGVNSEPIVRLAKLPITVPYFC